MRFCGSDNRSGDAGGLQDPRARDLRRGNSALFGDFRYGVGDFKVALAVVHVLGEAVDFGTNGGAAITLASAGEEAAGERTPGNHGESLVHAKRNHFALFLAIHQVVVILHGDEAVPAVLFRRVQGFRELPCGHAARTQMTDFAALHQRIEGVQSLFERR